jgi:hypothetical protein
MFQSRDSQILSATLQNLVDRAIWRPGFVLTTDMCTVQAFVWRVDKYGAGFFRRQTQDQGYTNSGYLMDMASCHSTDS